MTKTIALLLLVITSTQSAPLVDLYLPDDDVENLSIENFKKHVGNSTNAWLVEFYANWCGYCQRFAPSWKEFATEAAPWRDLVRVAVLPCSDEINTPICREFGITSYPTVRYFHENYHFSQENLGVEVPHEFPVTVNLIKKNVIETLMREVEEGRGAAYPNLLTYNQPNLDGLLDEESEDVEYGFLVVEDEDKYLGVEAALDLHKTPNITIRHSLKNNTDLINNLHIEYFPKLISVDRGNNLKIFNEKFRNKNDLKGTIKEFLETKGLRLVETIPEKLKHLSVSSNKTHGNTLLRQRIKKMGDVIFQMDLEAALRYSLLQEVSSVKSIKGEQLHALKSYLNVLKKYFPISQNSSLLTQLATLASLSEEIQGSHIEEVVKKAEDRGSFSSPQRFLGCQGSTDWFRGYPCSLWRLFHYLTVNSYQRNVNHWRANPTEVLEAMKGYIKHFFSCAHCSDHFLEMAAERNLTSVRSLEQSVFWLWEAHNLVNRRLKGRVSEDPEYPKEQFPTKLNCPECYEEDGSWNKSEVFKYLKRMYGEYNVRYVGSDTKMLFPGLD